MLAPELQQIRDAFESRISTGNLVADIASESEFRLIPQVADSFPITVSLHEVHGLTIALEPYHEHMSSVEQAISLAMWLLTPYYRVVTTYANNLPIKSHIEVFKDDGWDSRLGICFIKPEEGLPEPDEIRIRHQAVFLDSNFPRYYANAQLDQAGCPVGTLLGETIYHQRNGEWHPTNVPEIPEHY